jgi:hypothetical protein
MKRWIFFFLTALVLLCVPAATRAQWLTQPVALKPGWNAVYLEVQPVPGWCDSVFTNTPVTAVWKWNRRFTSIQFRQDPEQPILNQPHWSVWFPSQSSNRVASMMPQLEGGTAYLIEVNTNATAFTLNIKGRVILPTTRWFPHTLNLIGASVMSNSAPTFSDYFTFTPEIDLANGSQNQLYTIDSRGTPDTIVQPARVSPQAGKAYWIECARSPSARSPLQVIPSAIDALDFGTSKTEDDLTIRNLLPDRSMQVTVKAQNSETTPAGADVPALLGPVPLSYMIEKTDGEWDWTNFPSAGLTRTLAAGEEWTLRLGVRRSEMVSGSSDGQYQSILRVSDTANGLQTLVPVRAEPAVQTRASTTGTTNDPSPHYVSQGLWVGEVILAGVNAPAYSGTNILITTAPCSMRLLLFVDSYKRVHLLQRAMLAWDDTLNAPPHTNGAFAIFTDESALPANAGDVYSITAAAFPLMAPLELTGSFTNELSGTLHIAHDDPTNPYLHRYHPMHDNKDWEFQPYTNAVEVPDISRTIHLAFANPSTNSPYDPFWGTELVAGRYTETIEGLRAQPVITAGSFALQRVSTIGEIKN